MNQAVSKLAQVELRSIGVSLCMLLLCWSCNEQYLNRLRRNWDPLEEKKTQNYPYLPRQQHKFYSLFIGNSLLKMFSSLLWLGPYSSLGQDASLLLPVVIHLLQVGYVPELHPKKIKIRKKLNLNFNLLKLVYTTKTCKDSQGGDSEISYIAVNL